MKSKRVNVIKFVELYSSGLDIVSVLTDKNTEDRGRILQAVWKGGSHEC